MPIFNPRMQPTIIISQSRISTKSVTDKQLESANGFETECLHGSFSVIHFEQRQNEMNHKETHHFHQNTFISGM